MLHIENNQTAVLCPNMPPISHMPTTGGLVSQGGYAGVTASQVGDSNWLATQLVAYSNFMNNANGSGVYENTRPRRIRLRVRLL